MTGRRVRAILGLGAFLCLMAGQLGAYPRMFFESEPNDEPLQANEVMGESHLVGEVSQDDTDYFLWVLGDREADRRWSIELIADEGSGIHVDFFLPDELITDSPDHAPQPDAGGDSFGTSDTFGSADSFGTADSFGSTDAFGTADAPGDEDVADSSPQALLSLYQSANESSTERHELLVPPGEFLVRVTTSGAGGQYQLLLTEGSSYRGGSRINSATEHGHHLRAQSGQRFLAEVPEVRLPLPVDAEEQLWRLSVRGELNQPLEAWVESPEGERLADSTGSFAFEQTWGGMALPAGSALHLRHLNGERIERLLVDLSEDGRLRASLAADLPQAQGEDEPAPLAATESERLWLAPGESIVLDYIPGIRQPRRHLGFQSDGETPLRLSLAAEHDSPLQVCLMSLQGGDEVCREGLMDGLFHHMVLPAGDYALVLTLNRFSETRRYEVRLDNDEAAADGSLGIPNNDQAWARRIVPGREVQGDFTGSRDAWFHFVVDEAQPWMINAAGDSLQWLRVFEPNERRALVERAQERGESGPLWLDRLFLPEGEYFVHLRRSSAEAGDDYQLLISADERSTDGMEVEPNDDPLMANPLRLGDAVGGTFHSSGDQDHFHFSLAAESQVLFELTPPDGRRMTSRLIWQQDEQFFRFSHDETETRRLTLPAGDYVLDVSADGPSRELYQVRASLASPWLAADEQLPVDSPEEARLMPAHGRLEPVTDDPANTARYVRLPSTADAREIRIHGQLIHRRSNQFSSTLVMTGASGEPLEMTEHDEGYEVATIPAGESILVEVSHGRRSEGLRIEDPAYPLPEPAQASLAISSPAEAVAAFYPGSQQFPVTLQLSNPSDEPITVTLEHALSHHGATLRGMPDSVALAPGGEDELAMTLQLAPEQSDELPLTLFVRGHEGSAGIRFEWPVREGQAPVNPEPVAEFDPALGGLTNLAWNALGATFVSADSGEPIDDFEGRRNSQPEHVLDGIASVNSATRFELDAGDAASPLRLAGDGGQVQALVINQRSPNAYSRRWRHVEVALGNQHDDFTPVMTIELQPQDGDQVFWLESPQSARYVQLRPLSSWAQDGGLSSRNASGVGTLQVLGVPEGVLAAQRNDLISPALGGQWIYTHPAALRSDLGFTGHRYLFGRDLSLDTAARGRRVGGRHLEMVFAFLNHRAALVDEFHWQDAPDWQGLPVEAVEVYASEDSPVGPWKKVAEWPLERGEDHVARLSLDAPVRARYLKFAFDEPAVPEGENRAEWRLPMAIRAFEAPTLASGDSILGYWGIDHSLGPMEAQRSEGPGPLLEVEDNDSQADAPYRLTEQVTGQVSEPGDTRYYQVRVGEGENTLSFRLQGKQVDKLQASLLDAQGESIALEWEPRGEGGRQASVSQLSPGDYTLTITEPPRSIMFLWDGSGSVASHQPAIYQALGRFAESLEPGKEVFNMLPLEGVPLLDGWAEQGYQVRDTLRAYDNRFTGSNSDPTLSMASRALRNEPGEKIIFLMTDAEQLARDMSAWQDMASVRPRIFAIELSSHSGMDTDALRHLQGQMMSWANVNRGRYFYAPGRQELLLALQQGMREVRSPTAFALQVARSYEEPPLPGSVEVVSGESPVVAGGAIHLIFDASGSMLRRMEGGRRIDVARRVVNQVLAERIPSHVPVALRAFGHTEPHSCETALLVAPSANNHQAVQDAVDGIQAINLARTPLADSLDEVLTDLGDFSTQRSLVVMLTDGEETCDGDVEASVEALIDSGVDVRLSIVGFHIDELEWQMDFERFAALGGGEYFDSHDAEELVDGLVQALAAEWEIFDSEGVRVERGRVDGPAVQLTPGDYELRVRIHSGDWVEPFTVEPGANLRLEVDNDA